MKFKSRFNRNGFTLIELLASLTIFIIVMTLVSGVIVNSMKQFEISRNKISLSQEANLILAEITKLHQTREKYHLSYNKSSKNQFWLELDGKRVGKSNIDVLVKAIGQYDYKNVAVLDTFNLSIDTEKPLFIEISLEERGGTKQDYHVKTVINRK